MVWICILWQSFTSWTPDTICTSFPKIIIKAKEIFQSICLTTSTFSYLSNLQQTVSLGMSLLPRSTSNEYLKTFLHCPFFSSHEMFPWLLFFFVCVCVCVFLQYAANRSDRYTNIIFDSTSCYVGDTYLTRSTCPNHS